MFLVLEDTQPYIHSHCDVTVTHTDVLYIAGTVWVS